MKSKKGHSGSNPTKVVIIQPKQSKASKKPVLKSWREAKAQDPKSKKGQRGPNSIQPKQSKASAGVHIQSASAELEMREHVLNIWRETKGQEPMQRARERMKQRELLGQIDQVLTDLWEEKKMDGLWDFNCLLYAGAKVATEYMSKVTS